MAVRKSRNRAAEAGIGVTIAAGVLIALFAALGVGPLLHLAARVLPTTETTVTVVERERIEAQGYHPFRPVRLADDRYSYFVTVRRENGDLRRIDAPAALYEAALPGLTTLVTIGLEETVVLGIPVGLTMTGSTPGAAAETYSLLIPLTGIVVAGIFAVGLGGYLTVLVLRRRGINRPVLFATIATGAALGAWWWL